MDDIYNTTYLKIADLTGRHEKLNHLSWDELREIGKITGLNEKKIILDVCCGRGGIAKLYAGEFGCRVKGIDASKTLIDDAKVQIEEAELSSLVDLEVGLIPDSLNRFADYDIVICIESLCHIANRDHVIAELKRKVKKDGYLVIHDWIIKDQKYHSRVKDLLEKWHFPSLETAKSYVEHFEKHRIKIVRHNDLTESLIAFRKSLYKRCKEVKEEVERLLGKGSSDEYLSLVRLAKEYAEAGYLGAILLIGVPNFD